MLNSSNFLYIGIVTFLSLYPFWLPIFLAYIFMHTWIRYVREKFISKQGEVLLEIKLPREITKSPLSMEIILAALWQKASATLHDTYLNGKCRPWFSFELASIGGQVHFYIWTAPKYRALIESQFYSQYPGVEIVETEDYTKGSYHDVETRPMWACYYKKGKPLGIDSNMVPIRTYMDFGLDKAGDDEENKHDPLAATLEWMGSIQRGEQIWIQIMFQAHRDVGFLDAHFFSKKDWKGEANNAIKTVMKKAAMKGEGDKEVNTLKLTKMENDVVNSIQRNLSKHPFDVCIRGLYIATKESNKIGERVPGLIGAFRQFSGAQYFNELKLAAPYFTDFDYPWDDFMRMRRSARERKMLDAYKKRSYFQYPYKNYLMPGPIIMSTEEIATIFHLPGTVVATPTLNRIESKKSDAPVNLPV
jgi:hypothetical protein